MESKSGGREESKLGAWMRTTEAREVGSQACEGRI